MVSCSAAPAEARTACTLGPAPGLCARLGGGLSAQGRNQRLQLLLLCFYLLPLLADHAQHLCLRLLEADLSNTSRSSPSSCPQPLGRAISHLEVGELRTLHVETAKFSLQSLISHRFCQASLQGGVSTGPEGRIEIADAIIQGDEVERAGQQIFVALLIREETLLQLRQRVAITEDLGQYLEDRSGIHGHSSATTKNLLSGFAHKMINHKRRLVSFFKLTASEVPLNVRHPLFDGQVGRLLGSIPEAL